LRSQQRFARRAGPTVISSRRIVAVRSPQEGTHAIRQRRAQPADTTLETLARLQAGVPSNGSHHRRQRPRIERCRGGHGARRRRLGRPKRGLAPTARLVSYGIAAVEPRHVRIGTGARRQAGFAARGWDIRSVERVEINEAFAAIAIVVARELGLPEDIVNVEAAPSRMAIRSAPPARC